MTAAVVSASSAFFHPTFCRNERLGKIVLIRHSEKARQNKRANAKDREENKTLIREPLQRDPEQVHLSKILDERQNCSNRHAKKRNSHQHESGRWCVFAFRGSNCHTNEKANEQREK